MSLKIIKAGILDSLQDTGRFGYRQYGINPSGAMDIWAAKRANRLVGNTENDAVIELHFPAAAILFEKPAIMALTGADFAATVDDQFIAHDQAIYVKEELILRFTQPLKGNRCYLAVRGGLEIQKWLDSYSTHLKAGIGGFKGRRLMKDDRIDFRQPADKSDLPEISEPGYENKFTDAQEIMILPGPEWHRMSEDSQHLMLNKTFTISTHSDRMGYRLTGPPLITLQGEEMISSGVCFGTIQLIPDGSLILLMADHQTTGGYPRIATVISVFHSALAQKKPGDSIRFRLVDIETAENLMLKTEELHGY